MHYSVAAKFAAVMLCAAMLLTAAAGAVGLFALEDTGLGSEQSLDEYVQREMQDTYTELARQIASIWLSREYGDMPGKIADARLREAEQFYFTGDGPAFEIRVDGEVVDSVGEPSGKAVVYDLDEVILEHYLGEESEVGRARSAETDQFHVRFVVDPETGRAFSYAYTWEYVPNNVLSVELYPETGKLANGSAYELLGVLDACRGWLMPALLGGLLLFAVAAVYLCCAACRRPGSEEKHPAGLNVLPLDLYFVGCCGFWAFCFLFLDEFDSWFLAQSWQTTVFFVGSIGYLCCLAFVAFCFACAAQFKMGQGHWFWNSLCGRCLKLALWLLKKGLHLVPGASALALRLWKDAWKVGLGLLSFLWAAAGKLWKWMLKQLARLARTAERFFALLPMTWQWLVVGFGLLFIMGIAGSARSSRDQLLCVGFCLAVVLYGANCFGTLLDAVRRMRGGDLETKVDSRYMVGSFREFSADLNGLADVAMVAAQKQLRSERMKTELITNVSHDIKTPLTSIINYVDLLEKPHTPEEERAYLDVLHRQSQRMKKLIEDLMEMSKASTGNIPVEITRIDAVEAVNQALGEFSDKLSAAGLTVVFRQPEEEISLLADGKLLWRAMSNVLSNAVKYALPGTRLYVDIAAVEDKAVISFKNISGAQLNITAEELMERFVRGDSSRNTEGSGLGLNIAKSLMELQKGQLHLLVDGDLFKVTLVFPRV